MKLKLKIFNIVWHTVQERTRKNHSFGFYCCNVKCSFGEEEKIPRVLEKILAMLMSDGGLIVQNSQ